MNKYIIKEAYTEMFLALFFSDAFFFLVCLRYLESYHYICNMKDFKLLIEELLMEHNCLIVPGFGAFVANYAPSEYIKQEELFLPPYRKVHFNADIVTDDKHVLAHAIMEQERVEMPMADIMIAREVLTIRQELLENGVSDFGSIGMMTQCEGQDMVFQPCQAGINSPDLFGLYSFQMACLRDTAHIATDIPTPKDAKHYTISLNRAFVHYTMATAAAVALFFMFITPVENTQPVEDQTRSELFIPFNLTEEHHTSTPLIVTDTPIDTDEPEEEIAAPEEDITEEIMEEEPVVQKEEGKYGIVIASAITLENATALAEKLKGMGYANAMVHTKGNMNRVILGGYTSESAAYEKANQYVDTDPLFDGIWVMSLAD